MAQRRTPRKLQLLQAGASLSNETGGHGKGVKGKRGQQQRLDVLGRTLRSMRKERRLTVVNLQEASSVHHSSISRIENGKDGSPTIETLANLAQALDVPLYRLVGPSYDPMNLPSTDMTTVEILRQYHKLPEEDRKHLQEYLAYLESKSRKGGE